MSPLGVLHPLFVHFPFALVVTAAFLELLARRRDRTRPSAHTFPLLAIAAVGAVGAAATGWLAAEALAGNEALAGRVSWHRWLGIASVVVIAAAASLFRSKDGEPPVEGRLRGARALLLVALALVGVGGHLGAELTHGRETYLRALDRLLGRDPTARGADERERAVRDSWAQAALSRWEVPPDAPIEYENGIQPILVAHCWSCHGPDRVRGGLRLDTRERAILGGDSGPGIVPGDPGESPLWSRCVTDTEEFPRMPEDAPPLPKEWTDAIARWIEEGAVWPEPEPTPWR